MSEFVVACTTALGALCLGFDSRDLLGLFKVAQDQVKATIIASKEQMDNANQAAKMLTYVQVTNQLSLDREIRSDRLIVLNHEQGTKWSGDEHEAAFRVFSAFNVAAVLAYEGAIPKDLFVKRFGAVLCKSRNKNGNQSSQEQHTS